MKAVRMYAPRDLRVEEVDIPSYASDECLIKVMAVGVCGSDIPRVNQYGAHVSPIIVSCCNAHSECIFIITCLKISRHKSCNH